MAAEVSQHLQPHPPTPPRNSRAISETSNGDTTLLPMIRNAQASLQTPPNLPTSIQATASTSRAKRVGFSVGDDYREAPAYASRDKSTHRLTPISLPTSASRPIKSILKPTLSSQDRYTCIEDLATEEHTRQSKGLASFGEMLETCTQTLAGVERNAKVDAYVSLLRGCKASNDLSDRVDLQAKASLLVQYAQRDLLICKEDGTTDTILVVQALRLLNLLLHLPTTASTISHEIAGSILEHCISSLSSGLLGKEVARQLLQTIRVQRFANKVMTPDRLRRLVMALHDIENTVKGKTVIYMRVEVYRRLLQQWPSMMAANAEWLPDLLTDMLSSVSDIRSVAAQLGLEAAYACGRDKTVIKRVTELLVSGQGDDMFLDFMMRRMSEMLSGREEAASVPLIWSIIVLFLPKPISWSGFGKWSEPLKKSFNCSNHDAKREANRAWLRLVYRMYLDNHTFSTQHLRILRGPWSSQLRLRARHKLAEEQCQTVVSSLCGLFFYLYRTENKKKEQLNTYWDEAVQPLLLDLAARDAENETSHTKLAATVLTALLDCTTQRVCESDRIKDPSPFRPDELPGIDIKWIRRNTRRIFALLQPILRKAFSDMHIAGSVTHRLWRTLLQSVARASARDVKLDNETVGFMNAFLNLVSDCWCTGWSMNLEDLGDCMKAVTQELGLLPNPFTDRTVTKMASGEFATSSTPSSHRETSSLISQTPLCHMFATLARLPTDVADDASYADMLIAVFAPLTASRSPVEQSDLVLELFGLIKAEERASVGSWACVAQLLSSSLNRLANETTKSVLSTEIDLGKRYRSFVSVLQKGLELGAPAAWAAWQCLLRSLIDLVKSNIGDAGVAMSVFTPLSLIITDHVTSTTHDWSSEMSTRATAEMLSIACHIIDQQAMDVVSMLVQGPIPVPTAAADLLWDLLRTTDLTLELSYAATGDSGKSNECSDLIQAVSRFLQQSGEAAFIRSLQLMQAGLAMWFRDRKGTVHGVCAQQLRALWQLACGRIKGQFQPANMPLTDLEVLLVATLESPDAVLVSTTAQMWNDVYQEVEHIEYPPKLRISLISLGSAIMLIRPGLSISNENGSSQNLSVAYPDEQMGDPISPLEPASRPTARKSCTLTPGLATRSSSLQSKQSRSSPIRPRKSTTDTPIFRHDDSQIDFVPVDSSPFETPDSQLLTERQRDIRERPKDFAGVVPEFHSSPMLPSANIEQTPAKQQTPKQTSNAHVCFNLTPTPRRSSQANLSIGNDDDLDDVPSSPPGDPRSHPLFAELRAKLDPSNLLSDNFQLSSSPVPESPSPKRSMLASLPQTASGTVMQLSKDAMPADEPKKRGPGRLRKTSMQLQTPDIALAKQKLSPSLDVSKTPAWAPSSFNDSDLDQQGLLRCLDEAEANIGAVSSQQSQTAVRRSPRHCVKLREQDQSSKAFMAANRPMAARKPTPPFRDTVSTDTRQRDSLHGDNVLKRSLPANEDETFETPPSKKRGQSQHSRDESERNGACANSAGPGIVVDVPIIRTQCPSSEADEDEAVHKQLVMEAEAAEEHSLSQQALENMGEEEEQDAPTIVRPADGNFARLRNLLDDGLRLLEGAKLDRQEVSQIEDMMYDMKRKLYKAS